MSCMLERSSTSLPSHPGHARLGIGSGEGNAERGGLDFALSTQAKDRP